MNKIIIEQDDFNRLVTTEYFRLKIENSRYLIPLKLTERSDIHKSSIFNLQSSLPACPAQRAISLLKVIDI
jgi:hypothetical protein